MGYEYCDYRFKRDRDSSSCYQRISNGQALQGRTDDLVEKRNE